MIKSDAAVMQALLSDFEVEVPLERRQSLARKGERLYEKYCGTKGCGICAESFAEYHIWRGELEVARDFLIFLNAQIDALKNDDPDKQLYITQQLIARIENLLGEEAVHDAEPRLLTSI